MNLTLRAGTQYRSLDFIPDRLKDRHPLGKRISPQVRLQRHWTRAHSTPDPAVKSGRWEGPGRADRRAGFQPPSTWNSLCELMQVPALLQPSVSPSKPWRCWIRTVGLNGGSLDISRGTFGCHGRWMGHGWHLDARQPYSIREGPAQ